MKIWITGIAGFIGSRLAGQLIAEGHEVSGNDNMICGDINNAPSCISYFYTDCRNFEPMKHFLCKFKPDVLVHCAATAHEGFSNFSPSFITQNIFEASVATFSAAIAAGVKRIVFMSSMARYGCGHVKGINTGDSNVNVVFQRPPFKEHYIPYPIDPYGIAKVAAEDVLKVLCSTHGVKWSIAVPHNVIGVGQRYVDPYRNVAAIMINRCKQGKPPIVYGDGLQERCFSPIADCLPSLIKIIHGEADGEIINIGPDNGQITVKSLAERICNITGYNGEIQHIPDRPNEVKMAYTSSDKARNLLGYEPRQSLEECLREMDIWIDPKPFIYDFPQEIITAAMPATWRERLM